jgi:hypothetical protein
MHIQQPCLLRAASSGCCGRSVLPGICFSVATVVTAASNPMGSGCQVTRWAAGLTARRTTCRASRCCGVLVVGLIFFAVCSAQLCWCLLVSSGRTVYRIPALCWAQGAQATGQPLPQQHQQLSNRLRVLQLSSSLTAKNPHNTSTSQIPTRPAQTKASFHGAVYTACRLPQKTGEALCSLTLPAGAVASCRSS